MLKYVAEKLGAKSRVDIVSADDTVLPQRHYYRHRLFGGGQDYEQSILAKDLPTKKNI